jgi:arylsulfatase A-like enzyme
MRRGPWFLLVLAAVLLGGCRRPDRAPNVVLLTLDTVRADRMGLYGHAVRNTPRLEQLARQATLYRRAQAAGSWTVPGHASIFTGRAPFEHGADTLAPEPGTEGQERVRPLDPSHVTLAESLHELGYQSAAIVANAGYLAPRWGLDQGFDTYVVQRGHADVVTGRAIEWLDKERARDKPFFLFVNYMDAHRPYNARERPGLLPRPVGPDKGHALRALYAAAMPNTGPPPAELMQTVSDQYDTAIANLDEQLGALFESLQGSGLYDDTVIVVTSDHGEFLGEHNLVEHSKDVYQEVIGIPLLVKAPRQAQAAVEERLASQVDVPRLVLQHLPRALASRVEARYPDTLGAHPVIAENYYARAKDLYGQPWSARLQRVRTALYDGPMKLIHSSDGRHELYDLQKDPRETRDLMTERPELAASLQRGLSSFRKSRVAWGGPARPAQPLSDDELEELRALGYVAGPGGEP